MRNFRYIEKNKIIYRRDPITDVPDYTNKDYMYFARGTYECYDLFRSKAKITTHKSLVWHLTVLWYLNPDLNLDQFKKLALNVSDRKNNFTTFTISEKALQDIVNLVYSQDLERPPKNKLRKIIFNDSCTLSAIDKLRIVGSIIGKTKKVDQSDIYEAMITLNDNNEKITVKKLSSYLKVTTRTIYRNMDDQLKSEKLLLNASINEKVQCKQLHTL